MEWQTFSAKNEILNILSLAGTGNLESTTTSQHIRAQK